MTLSFTSGRKGFPQMPVVTQCLTWFLKHGISSLNVCWMAKAFWASQGSTLGLPGMSSRTSLHVLSRLHIVHFHSWTGTPPTPKTWIPSHSSWQHLSCLCAKLFLSFPTAQSFLPFLTPRYYTSVTWMSGLLFYTRLQLPQHLRCPTT